MFRHVGWWLSVLVIAVLSACGGDDSVGRTGEVVGGPCDAAGGCAEGSSCLVDSMYPGGMCTLECASQSDCPDGTRCVQESGGRCLLACSSDDDCREGYGCNELSTPPDGHAFVCIR